MEFLAISSNLSPPPLTSFSASIVPGFLSQINHMMMPGTESAVHVMSVNTINTPNGKKMMLLNANMNLCFIFHQLKGESISSQVFPLELVRVLSFPLGEAEVSRAQAGRLLAARLFYLLTATLCASHNLLPFFCQHL
jgi:hypothetical protein